MGRPAWDYEGMLTSGEYSVRPGPQFGWFSSQFGGPIGSITPDIPSPKDFYTYGGQTYPVSAEGRIGYNVENNTIYAELSSPTWNDEPSVIWVDGVTYQNGQVVENNPLPKGATVNIKLRFTG